MADGADLDTVAAALRAETTDLPTLVELLAYKLELALPGRAIVTRRPVSFLSKRKRVDRLEIPLGDLSYVLQRGRDGRIAATKAHVVRGIVLSTDELDVDTWLRGLVVGLQDVARTSERDRVALERELLGPL
jgi:hypothetical protein